jgi:argininosuccinate synthase
MLVSQQVCDVVNMLSVLQELRKLKQYLSSQFSQYIYTGFWYSPEGNFVRECLAKSQESVEGIVQMQAYKGHVCNKILKKI